MGRQVRVGSRHRAARAGRRRDVADGDGQDKVDGNWARFLQVRAGRRRRSVADKTTKSTASAAAVASSGQLRTGRASSRRTRDNDNDDDDDDDDEDEELQALLLSFTYLLSLSLMVRPNIHRVK